MAGNVLSLSCVISCSSGQFCWAEAEIILRRHCVSGTKIILLKNKIRHYLRKFHEGLYKGEIMNFFLFEK